MRPARPCAPDLSRPSETTPALTDLSRRTQSTSCTPRPAPAFISPRVIISVLLRTQHGAPNRRESSVEKSKLRQALQDIEGRDVERVALVGVEQRDLGQRDADRPYAPLPAALVEEPEKERRQAIEDRLRAEREIDGLVMLDDQSAVEIRETDGERLAIDMRGEDGAGLGAEAHVARRAASDRRSEFALDDEPETLERRQPVGDDGAAEFGLAFDVETGRRDARADEREDGREARAAAFDRAGTADAPSGGRLGLGLGLQVVIHRKLVARRGIGILSRRFCHIKPSLSHQIRHQEIIFQQKCPIFCALFH